MGIIFFLFLFASRHLPLHYAVVVDAVCFLLWKGKGGGAGAEQLFEKSLPAGHMIWGYVLLQLLHVATEWEMWHTIPHHAHSSGTAPLYALIIFTVVSLPHQLFHSSSNFIIIIPASQHT
jgi:hypothetical protein